MEALRPTVGRIFTEADALGGAPYQLLSDLCDGIGPRLSGTQALDDALLWAQQQFEAGGHENVHIEPVMVPKWVRGEERATLTSPRVEALTMLGLGGSVATPAGGIEAEVLVVDSKEALDALADDAIAGKLVLFNAKMAPYDPLTHETGYDVIVDYRYSGAEWAGARGAVGALVRSVTATSLNTPHTGSMSYGENPRVKIPTAALSIESAEFLARLAKNGSKVVVKLEMSARLEDEMVPSGNVVAELVGREKPEEIVVIGGHIDSWDVGQGAHDNGAGVVITIEALNLLRRLNLRPRRTIRAVLWTNEENGVKGGFGYGDAHATEFESMVAAVESDTGGAKVVALAAQMDDEAAAALLLEALKPVGALLEPIGVERVEAGYAGVDIIALRRGGVPCIGLEHDMSKYFDVHHTAADTVDKVDPAELAQGVAAMAALAYVLAEMPGTLVEPTARKAKDSQ